MASRDAPLPHGAVKTLAAEISTDDFKQEVKLFQCLSATRAQETVDNRIFPPETRPYA